MLPLLLDRNSIINTLLWGSTIILAITVHPLWLLLPIAFHACNDILHRLIGINIFDTDILVQRAYSGVEHFLDLQKEAGLDLGFNFYDGELGISRQEAQKKKWDFMWDKLGLEPGMRLMDVGCGYGEWLNYAKSKGAQVMGINFSQEQAAHVINNYSIEVLAMNWKDIAQSKELTARVFGQFDAVTFMDTVEHYVPATAFFNEKKKQAIYTDMFQFAHNLINKNSKAKRVFISLLHRENKKWDLRRHISAFIQNRTLSGYYPLGDDGLTQYAPPYFKELERFDRTEDYRITAVIDKEHFQTGRFKLTLKKILRFPYWFLIDPYLLHRLASYRIDSWMCWFGEDCYSENYDPDFRSKVTYVKLWWLVLEYDESGAPRCSHL